MASSGPKRVKRCRGSKASIRSPAVTPRLPLSWAIPSRPSPSWCNRRGGIWPCRWPPAFTRAWSGGIAPAALCWTNWAIFSPASPRTGKRGGRPAVYGRKTKLRDWFALEKRFHKAPSPVYGESRVTLRYYTYDLLWRRLGSLVRFVWVVHPTRGQLVLLCTDLTLPPLDIIRLYGWRFKIEVSFKQAIHTVGAYAYHFWMENMKPIRRGDGSQHPHRQSESYRQALRRKLAA